MEYDLSRLDKAIEKASALTEKYINTPHAYHYYTTMQECLVALHFAHMEAKYMQKMYGNVLNRLEMLEHQFNRYRKEHP